MGRTYMAPGLMWGWRTLSPTAPFNDGSPKTGPARARKVLVLMSDGGNTVSANAPFHSDRNIADADATTEAVCTNIKNDGVEIYTVAFEVTNNSSLDLLRRCASSPNTHFFNAVDSNQLLAAFQRIGAALASVRLTR
jgi:hypothetical protein